MKKSTLITIIATLAISFSSFATQADEPQRDQATISHLTGLCQMTDNNANAFYDRHVAIPAIAVEMHKMPANSQCPENSPVVINAQKKILEQLKQAMENGDDPMKKLQERLQNLKQK